MPSPTSPDAIIDELDELSLRALHARYLYAPSDYDRDVERLRRSVRLGYEDGDIPAGAIRAHAEASRDAREDAAQRIIAEQNNTIAALFAALRPDAQSQFLVVALRRDMREGL